MDRGLTDLLRLPALIEILLADASAGHQLLGASAVGLRQLQARLPAAQRRDGSMELGNLGVDLFGGILQLPPLAADLRLQSAVLGLGGHHVLLGDPDGGALHLDLHRVRFLVELNEQVSFLHLLVVVEQHLLHLARHTGSHISHVAVDIGVVRALGIERGLHPRFQKVTADPQRGDGAGQQQPLSPAAPWR